MSRKLTRRTFLRVSGVVLALPLLDAMVSARGSERTSSPRRMLAVCSNLGFHTPFLFPEQAGRNYQTTPYLEVLQEFRSQLTVFSGVSHPGVDGGHSAEMSFLTSAPHPGAPSFKNSISLDQLIAERIGAETRFPSLTLGTGGLSLSWTRGGVRIPAEHRPSKVFEKLFSPGGGGAVQRLRNGVSVLDLVAAQATQMQRSLGPNDRRKLDEYFTSVRELEQRLVQGQEWARKPKPKVDVPPPKDITDNSDLVGQFTLMFDLIHLAFKTDSTRAITFYLGGSGGTSVPKIPGVSEGWHNLSHHGQDPAKIDQLKQIELAKFEALRAFLHKLRSTEEAGENLLDRSMVLFGSHLGNASSHNTRNLPLVLAGGGFRHGQHLAFDRQNNTPLSNIYLSMLERMGLEVDNFGSSTGTLSGLELA